jgi:hypothetical protein
VSASWNVALWAPSGHPGRCLIRISLTLLRREWSKLDVQVVVSNWVGDPFKAWVAGSSPAALTIFFNNLAGRPFPPLSGQCPVIRWTPSEQAVSCCPVRRPGRRLASGYSLSRFFSSTRMGIGVTVHLCIVPNEGLNSVVHERHRRISGEKPKNQQRPDRSS